MDFLELESGKLPLLSRNNEFSIRPLNLEEVFGARNSISRKLSFVSSRPATVELY